MIDKIKKNAQKTYLIEAIVENYLKCIEELINIPMLIQYFEEVIKQGNLQSILNEIVLQSKIEFNYAHENIDDENA